MAGILGDGQGWILGARTVELAVLQRVIPNPKNNPHFFYNSQVSPSSAHECREL